MCAWGVLVFAAWPRLALPAPASCGPGVPHEACRPGVRVCAKGDRDRIGEWRYALTAGPFEPTLDVTPEQLAQAWRSGRITADAETAAVLHLEPLASGTSDWHIVPAHTLSPATSVITVGGVHPLADADEPLAVALCGTGAPLRNIDPAKLTTLVMSGTSALTGRTAERIDDHGIADTIRWIKPFFASANLVHISNEVSFVRDCHPRTGQKPPLKFCARDRYIELLAALHATIIELTGSHLQDYGPRTLLRTVAMYEHRGWLWFGGGRTQLEATEARLVEDHGNKLAFVGCNAVNWWVRAISQGPGTADCDWKRLARQVQDLRRAGYLPIVSIQHREVRTHAPPDDLVHELRYVAEAGAAFIEGSQAHVAHPWDVHFGAYVHYGPGNILFAQYREEQREASVDKLYIHDGKLLTVGHLFVRTEHGQPRLLHDDERVRFLGELADAEAAIAAPRPTGTPPLPPPSPTRPDSVIVHGKSQHLAVTLEQTGDAEVARVGAVLATDEDIAAFVRAKYHARRVSVHRQ